MTAKRVSDKVEAIANGLFQSLQLITNSPQEAYEVLLCVFILFHIETGEHTIDEFCNNFITDFTDGATQTQIHRRKQLQ
jgi:hypothetical protein